MGRSILFFVLVIYLLFAAGWVVMSGVVRNGSSTELLNVANDPTRELWRDMNEQFIAHHANTTGQIVSVSMSHGGSGSQARSIIDGLHADVATLGLWSDTDMIRKAGLIDADWEERFPNRGLPFVSTIVFVVRKGNPKNIRDWADLNRADVTIVTPNPKTSGNGKWSLLAMWAVARERGLSEAEAERMLADIFRRVPVLDAGARGATLTFTEKALGDVLLTWENEAISEVADPKRELEIVHPNESILAEPHMAIVDANVRKKKTGDLAKAYLKFVYSAQGQDIGARHGYRPTQIPVPTERFPAMRLIPTSTIGTWPEIQAKFFASGALFDRVLEAGRRR